MGRRARAATMKRITKTFNDKIEQDFCVLTVLWEEILPLTIAFLYCACAYIFTMSQHRLIGRVLPVLLREAPFVLLLFHIYMRGRKDRYRNWIMLALVISMLGDYFMMMKDAASFFTGMAIYAMMHLIYIVALGFDFISKYSFIAAMTIAATWNAFLLPYLTGNFCWIVPPYICIVSLTFWRGFSQRGLGHNWTKACGAMGTLFLLCSDFNFSINVFFVTRSYDPSQVITMELYFVGQLFMALSTFKRQDRVILLVQEPPTKKR